jgi:predicted MPP superfamily phosphohydrolase
MAIIYAISDIHGELEVLKETLLNINLENKENKLILLGDYLDQKGEKTEIFTFLKNLQDQYNNQVVALMGNHEFMLLENIQSKSTSFDDKTIINWLKALKYFYETDTQIFVHAGVDEEAGEDWKWGTEDYYFCCKYPHTIGKFDKDIIAGHIGTCTIVNDKNYHNVFWDNQSHFYIDGTTETSKFIPVLKYDTKTNIYTSFEKVLIDDNSFIWREYIIKKY